MAARNEVAIDVTSRNMATRELDAASNSLLQLGNQAQNSSFMARTASGIWQGAMISIGNSINQFVMQGMALVSDALIGFNARTEQALIGFTTMLGSAAEAQGFLEQLQDFAAATPFEFDGLRQSANLIMAMGFEAREVIPLMTAAGDAVAALGLGTEAVQRVVYALGQMKAAGRVTGQDMMQLASMGIPAWKMLADAVGMTVQEAKKAAEQGLIDAETAIEGITTAIEEGDMGGMMAAQARTFNGAISTVKDTIQIVVAGAFKPLFETVSAATIGLADFLGSGDFLAWADDAGAAINDVIGLIVDLGQEIVPIAMTVLPAMFDAIVSVADILMRTLQVVLPLLGGVLSALGQITPAIAGLVGPLTTMAVTIGILTLGTRAWVLATEAVFAVQVIWATGMRTLNTLLPGFRLQMLLTVGGIKSFGIAVASAIPVVGWLAAAITALMSVIDVGDVIAGVAMDFGDMGDAVNATADSVGTSNEEIKLGVREMADELELSFEDSIYIINRFGADTTEMSDDVAAAMEALGANVVDATMFVETFGENWEFSWERIKAASDETNVTWESVFDHLQTLNAGMLTNAEIIQMMNDAAAESPEAFARLGADLTETEQAAVDLNEQFKETTAAIDEAGYDWVRSVKKGKDGIVVTLRDGTQVVADTADEMMAQLAQITEERMEQAQQSVSDMIDGITTLFDTADDARAAITEFAEFMVNSMTDVQQIKIILERVLQDDLPTAWSDGKTANDVAALDFVNSTLEQFDAIKPGLIAKGRDGGTGLLQGMQTYREPLLEFATGLAGDMLEDMTLAEAMRELGYDGLAAYIEGIEGQEDAAARAARQTARAAREAAEAEEGGYRTSGSNSGRKYGEGVRAPANLDYTRTSGELLADAAIDGTETSDPGTYGSNFASDYASGIINNLGVVADAGRQLATTLRSTSAIESEPDDHSSPLYGHMQWGRNFVTDYANSMRSAIPLVASAASDLASAAVPGAFAPAFGGAFPGGGGELPIGPALMPGGGSNITVNLNSTFPPTPAQGQAVAQAIIPELQREMRNQGLA